jgi:hypothetical protein
MSTVRIQLRRGTATEWTNADTALNASGGLVLAAGEMAVETNTRKIKIGDGTSRWSALSYVASDSPAITEIAQDAIDQALSMGSGLEKSYNDSTNTISITIDDTVVALKSYVDSQVGGLENTVSSDYVLLADVGNAGGPAKLDVDGNLLIPKSSIVLEGATANNFETTLTVVDPTADRTITFPDASGTVALTSDITSAVNNLVDAAPGALDTLNELAAALGDDANYATTITDALGAKLSLSGGTMTGSITLSGAPSSNLHPATKKYVDDIAAEQAIVGLAHVNQTETVHGITSTADLAYLSDIGTHNSDSTNVHGIADTAELATKDYANNAVETHSNDSTNVHGLSNTADLMLKTGDTMTGLLTLSGAPSANLHASTKQYVDETIDSHIAVNLNVHGIADTAQLATKSYADTAESDAIAAAESFTTTAINALDTDDIEEGSTNQYYTSVRSTADAVAAMSAGTNEVVTDSLEVSTNDFNVGADAKDLRTDDDYTNPIAVFSTAANDYAQVVVKNTTDAANSSTDIIAYSSNGVDSAGYINMGITAPSFSDPDFTITGGNDGYIFMEAPVGTSGDGNLVIATGGNGTHNHIVFAAGGLQSNNTQMTIFPDENVHIEIDTPSVSPTTGALTVVGGVGIQGDLNINGDVNIEGTIVFGGEGTTVETSNLSVTDPLIFVGNDNSADIIDLGFIGEYTTGGNTKYAGIIRDASDGAIKVFKDASTKPTSTVNLSEAGLAYADMQVAGLTASSLTVGDVSNTEFGYLNGVTSAIQTQIDTKSPVNDPTFTGTVTVSASGIVFSDGTQTKVGVPSITTFGTERTSSETLASGEQDKFVPLNGAVEITLPSSGYSTGQSIDFYQASGTGALFASTNSVVGTPGLKFRTTNSVVTAMKTPSGWLVFGDLKA